jgi:hypothetical protein
VTTKRTQQTKPKRGKPMEIPVPKQGEVEQLIRRAATPKKP